MYSASVFCHAMAMLVLNSMLHSLMYDLPTAATRAHPGPPGPPGHCRGSTSIHWLHRDGPQLSDISFTVVTRMTPAWLASAAGTVRSSAIGPGAADSCAPAARSAWPELRAPCSASNTVGAVCAGAWCGADVVRSEQSCKGRAQSGTGWRVVGGGEVKDQRSSSSCVPWRPVLYRAILFRRFFS